MTLESVHQACKDGDFIFMKEWLRNVEIDPNAPIDQHLFTPLHWASWYGHLPFVELLLTPPHSVKKDVVNMGEDTPLHCAAQHGKVEVIKRLLKDDDSNKANPGFRPINAVGLVFLF